MLTFKQSGHHLSGGAHFSDISGEWQIVCILMPPEQLTAGNQF